VSVGAERRRLRLTCRGVVQGVGFRPSVHRLATSLRLGGWVRNGPEGVVIEVEGDGASVGAFADRLPASLPPLARIDEMLSEVLAPIGERAFAVLASQEGMRRRALVPPDTALCRDCRREMEDSRDRRFHYPFTTCTNCGPRFSLVRALPYDRERTSMGCFPLCPDCQREYTDPADRRFHAEPVCCPACGPRLIALRPGEATAGAPVGGRALEAAREALARGEIVAVKGLGGFQLACRVDAEGVLGRLRRLKHRPSKPFALMARDLSVARRLVELEEDDEALMASSRAPVVLARRRADAPVAVGVAPGLEDLGVLLPTTPLHVELLRDAPYEALVMTSGNASDEPICRGNREAAERLGEIADLLLLHDRDVLRRVDDSVVRTGPDGWAMVRRARGWVPEPLPLPCAVEAPILALGGYLQVTACLGVGAEAFPSQHVGDLDTGPARGFLDEVVEGLEDFLQARARVIVVDPHPDYPSTWLGERLARERGGRLLSVQHHLAHIAAVLAERGAFPSGGESALGLALDGTGWGPDGTAWGGEWLRISADLSWRRLASLQPLPLVGGEAAVRQPWRVAAAALVLEGETALLRRLPLYAAVGGERVETVARLASSSPWPHASGAGRLFEAAGALLGLAVENGYEGEAAARCESCAGAAVSVPEPWPEVALRDAAGLPQLPGAALLAAAARRVAKGEPAESVAAGFHVTFCHLACELTVRVLPGGVRRVAVGGGCLVNRWLRYGLGEGLRRAGLEPLMPHLLPPGDGGLSYGQAVVGAVAERLRVQPGLEGGE
jgi:hydrogenase maturation protein HypF